MYKIYLGKAKVKFNAVVWQNMCPHEWGKGEAGTDGKDVDTIFEVYSLTEAHKECVALGFGVLGDFNSYGFGSLFVRNEDLIWEGEDPSWEWTKNTK